jgi:transcriptional regulator
VRASSKWIDDVAMRAFVTERSFAHLFIAGPDGPIVAHAPLTVGEDGAISFHLARSNPIVAHLDGAALIAVVGGPDFYVSPDWYAAKDGVPTWNYIAVEIEGTARRLSDAELVDQLDALNAEHEARLAPKTPWTRAKMPAGRFEAMTEAIFGFTVDAPSWRGIRKLSENKSAADRAGVIAALESTRPDHAQLVAEARP